MCGIAGFLRPSGADLGDAQAIARAMATTIAHRGPDDCGEWVDPSAGIALAHRRLSILDLSLAGHQPMVSDSGRYMVVFNGEIYNHLELRNALKNSSWRGHSDTETLLAAFEAWGIERSIRQLTGMFAFALWDREDRSLYLARDRMGEKPLYYGWQGQSFIFGSELKALRRGPEFAGEIDRNSLALYFRYGYIPAPYSIYRGIHKLIPGTFLRLPATAAPGALPSPSAFWSLAETWSRAKDEQFSGSDAEAVLQLEHHIARSVAGQIVADVPIGAFLSGGIDSSTIVALMQSQSSQRIKTFTIGFAEAQYNEAEHAKAVAGHLGTEHTELYVTPSDALAVIPELPEMYDEPFADASAIPTFLVSRLARRHVTVSLSGDGGDELFGGYSRYFSTARQWSRLRRLPLIARLTMAKVAGRIPAASARFPALKKAFTATSDVDYYRAVLSQWPDAVRIVKQALEPATITDTISRQAGSFELHERLMLFDSLSYLPDDILCKIDRAAMSVSLETRVPLLDHKLIEFATTLPLRLKIRGNDGKWLLRQVLSRYVPPELTNRPKRGFAIPVDQWIRGPLKSWAEDLLNEGRIDREGYLESAPIRARWRQHLAHEFNWRDPIWLALMFQAWLAHNQ
jgi:asparagine synthase (glutamine-hydrolysing)